jgi:hypothetical protein
MSLTQGSPLPNITTTQSQNTTAPSWYTDYLSNLANKSTTAAAGATYQGAQPLQTQAFGATAALPGTYQPGIADAAALAKGVGNTNVATRAGEFMQPYTSQVVDALGILGKRNINEYLAPSATAGAVGSGQFGSKRGAEVLGQSINTGLQNINAAQTQALQSGYTQALQAAQADQTNKLNAAQQMGALATAGQNMSLADINALATMGGQQQTIANNEQMFPLQALNAASQTVRGFTVPTNVSSSYTGPIPGAYAASPLSQIAGLGAILAGGSATPFGQAIGTGLTDWWKGLGSNPLGTSPATIGDGGGGRRDVPPGGGEANPIVVPVIDPDVDNVTDVTDTDKD